MRPSSAPQAPPADRTVIGAAPFGAYPLQLVQPFDVEGKTCRREDEGVAAGAVLPEDMHGPAGEAVDGAGEDMAVAPGEVFDVELAHLRSLAALILLSLAPHA